MHQEQALSSSSGEPEAGHWRKSLLLLLAIAPEDRDPLLVVCMKHAMEHEEGQDCCEEGSTGWSESEGVCVEDRKRPQQSTKEDRGAWTIYI